MLCVTVMYQAEFAEADTSTMKNRIREQIGNCAAELDKAQTTIQKIKSSKANIVEAFELKRNMQAASVRIQVLWRSKVARRELRKMIKATYKKMFDENTGVSYYYNTRTGESMWEKPKALGNMDVTTPESDGEPKRQRCRDT